MESLSDINLSDEEIAELLIGAKLKKKQAAFIESQKSEIQKEAERPWNAKEMWHHINKYILHKNPNYIFDEHNKKVIWILCLYFTKDPRFEQMGFSLDKGIMLAGNIGVGKSFLMECFMYNKRKCFQNFNCNNITDDFRDNGFDILKKYCGINTIIPDINFLYQKDLGICFDDLGKEIMPIRYFEYVINVMENIITRRYDNKIPFYYTHFTTNLDWNEIETVYRDTRTADRLYQMVNIIELAGESKRK